MAFLFDFGDIFDVFDDVVDVLDFGLLDIVETFTNPFGLNLFDSISGVLVNLFDEVNDDLLFDINPFDDFNTFDDLDSLNDIFDLGVFDTIGELIDNVDIGFFDDLTNLFDGFNLGFLDTLDDVFSEIDLGFFDDVIDGINQFDIVRNLDTVLDNNNLNGNTLTILSTLVDSLDDLTSFSKTTAEQLLEGTLLNDRISGTSMNDILIGLSGHDSLTAGGGDDLINGGVGNDILLGKRGIDVLFGHDGRDHLQGGSGSDVIAGGEGRDFLSGGRGPDVFFLQYQTGVDKIMDFKRNQDCFHLLDGVEFEDLKLLERRDRTLIKFGPSSEFGGRLAWVEGLTPEKFTAKNFVTVESNTISEL